MNVLEKILEEIGATEGIRFSRYTELLITVKDAEKIIRSHMDEVTSEKEKVTSAEIISRQIDGKPYYHIKFKKVGEDEYTIGYSSFKLDCVVKWLNDCFEFCGEAKVSCDDNGWIPVEERLPEEKTEVLCCFENGTVQSLWQNWKNDGLGDYLDDDLMPTKVIAWQPLPTRYIPPVISKQAQDLRDRESFFTE